MDCDSFSAIHGEAYMPVPFRAALCLLGLLYCFLGLGIITRKYMDAMDNIVKQERSVACRDETGALVTTKERLWNPTLADITLLALGTSAPPISLAIIAAVQELGRTRTGPDVGTETMFGGAAFNFFAILACCILIPQREAVKRVGNYGVFLVELLWSIWAYLWLYIVLQVWSPGEITILESWLTVLHLPGLMLHAYAQDQQWPWVSIPNTGQGTKALFTHTAQGAKGLFTHAAHAHRDPMAGASLLGPDHEPSDLPRELALFPSQGEKEHGRAHLDEKWGSHFIHRLHPGSLDQGVENGSHEPYAILEQRPGDLDLPCVEDHAGALGNALAGAHDHTMLPLTHISAQLLDTSAACAEVREAGPVMPANTGTYSSGQSLTCSPNQMLGPQTEIPLNHLFTSAIAEDLVTRNDANFLTSGGSEVASGRKKNEGVGMGDYVEDQTVALESFVSEPGVRRRGGGQVSILRAETARHMDGTGWGKDGTGGNLDGTGKHVDGTDNLRSTATSLEGKEGERALTDRELDTTSRGSPALVGFTEEVPGAATLLTAPGWHGSQWPGFKAPREVQGSSGPAGHGVSLHRGSTSAMVSSISPKAVVSSLPAARRGGSVYEHWTTQILEVFLASAPAFVDGPMRACEGRYPERDHSKLISEIPLDIMNTQDKEAAGRSLQSFAEAEQRCTGLSAADGGAGTCMGVGEQPDGCCGKPAESSNHLWAVGCWDAVGFFWKLLFALVVPPPNLACGWPAFLMSIAVISVISTVVIELAGLLTCLTGIRSFVISITLLAAGTAIPNVISSVIATQQSETADSAVANVNASNAINVYFGLGLPWIITSTYDAFVMNKKYTLDTATLGSSLTIYFATISTGLVVIFGRRLAIGGEFGGPMAYAALSSIGLMTLWVFYCALSISLVPQT